MENPQSKGFLLQALALPKHIWLTVSICDKSSLSSLQMFGLRLCICITYIYKTYPYDFPWNFQIEWSNKGYKYKQILFADDVSIRIIRAGQYQPQQISTHNKAIDAWTPLVRKMPQLPEMPQSQAIEMSPADGFAAESVMHVRCSNGNYIIHKHTQ